MADPTASVSSPRKQSNTDLHSRLKTRKLLGVGGTDDGDVHRSKLSQILGHSEQLYLKLPRGLRLWQFTTAFMFSSMAILAMFWPRSLHEYALNQAAPDDAVLPIRLYGSALLTLSVIFWNTLKAQDREVIRNSLLASAVYFGLQFCVCGVFALGSVLSAMLPCLFFLISILISFLSFYLYITLGALGHPNTKFVDDRAK